MILFRHQQSPAFASSEVDEGKVREFLLNFGHGFREPARLHTLIQGAMFSVWRTNPQAAQGHPSGRINSLVHIKGMGMRKELIPESPEDAPEQIPFE